MTSPTPEPLTVIELTDQDYAGDGLQSHRLYLALPSPTTGGHGEPEVWRSQAATDRFVGFCDARL